MCIYSSKVSEEVELALKEHVDFHSSESFEVEKLLDYRIEEGKEEVLVKWFGFDQKDSTWEPIDKLREDVPELLESFMSKRSLTRKI